MEKEFSPITFTGYTVGTLGPIAAVRAHIHDR
jgi:hypothetical protein